ncbi:hypothetical protein [Siccirubricoccus sp. G192]|uniref:hypothetical protein n=1 Tax=Siccirubricoccus sp. G192 TaxID=2849651 RepID=UPI001C2B9CB5|nr:hypothetical protein [Siccirubricoccus sp. G192]MBV1799147.1 hypothetical protein [Siccirubricoccus sp. G192]
MAKHPNEPPGGSRADHPRAEPEGDAFTPWLLWLERSLHQRFDAVAAEPIPEDLLRLIKEDRPERERFRLRRASNRDE